VAAACGNHKSVTAAFRVTTGIPAAARGDYVGIASTPDGQGYWLVRGDGQVAAFGDAHGYGSLDQARLGPADRVVGIARTYDARGYWLASADGQVFDLGDAHAYGSLAGHNIPAPVTSISPAPDGKGYYLLAANGTVFGFGSAHVVGAPKSYLAPYDAIVARPAGGYIVTAATDGVTYTYPGGVRSGAFSLSGMLVGTAVTPSGNGTWQAGIDGGVITEGDANTAFYGSVPGENVTLKAPVTAIAATPDGHGYWLVGANGTVFPFGDAKTYSS
jgi:ribosomal protein L24E